MARRRATALAAAAAAAFTGIAAGPAVAHDHVTTVAGGLAGPGALAVGSDGSIYVTQLMSGELVEVSSGSPIPLATASDGSVGGVAAEGRGTLTFTETSAPGYGMVKRLLPNGRIKTLGDTGAYEASHNPDQVNSYGFQDLTDECATEVDDAGFPPEVLPGGGSPYAGLVDSNSYSVAILPDGSRVVGDAGGNDLVRIRPNGRISTLAVLPPIPIVLPVEAVQALGLPDCTAGSTYHFDPVPTDVEVGPDGMLYVSSLPGGPEDGTLGAQGRVFRVDPRTGAVVEVASGFFGATDLAVAPNGDIYVTELFGGRISMANGATPVTVLEVEGPNAVEYHDGDLYAAVGFAFGPPTGEVIKIDL